MPRLSTDTRWLLALGLLALLCVTATCLVGRRRDFIGSPDQAAYAIQADSLLAGRGLTIGYVQHFYRRYAGISHPEDHYAPGMGALLAGTFRLFGRSEYTAILPSILLACLALPCLCYLLARQLTAPPAWAFACAVTVMWAHPIREHAFYALADLPFAVCVTGALALVLAGRIPALAGAGACLAAAGYLKPAALLFLPICLLILLLLHRPDWRRSLRAFLWLAGCFLLLFAPWLARNWRLFHDPLYSVNTHIAAGIDYDREFWDTQFTRVWWANPALPPPTPGSLIHRYPLGHLLSTLLFRLQRALFVVSGWASFCIFLSLLTLCGLLFQPVRRLCYRRVDPPAQIGIRRMQAAAALPVFYLLFLCLTFSVRARYLLPVIPAGFALAWALASRVGPGAMEDSRTTAKARFVVALAAILAATGIAGFGLVELGRQYAGSIPLQRDDMQVKPPALWAAAHLPRTARVMAFDPWQFCYYARCEVVNVPGDTPDHIQAVVEAYRLQYLFLWESRDNPHAVRRLRAYLALHAREWRPVHPPGESFMLYCRRDSTPSP